MLPPISDPGRGSDRATMLRWTGAVTVVLLCMSLATAPAVAAEPTPTPSPTQTEEASAPAVAAPGSAPPEEPLTTRVRESLHHLMTTYGVDEAEGLRRLRLQADAPDLIEVVREEIR